MLDENWYHQWFLNEENPSILYVTINGHSPLEDSFRRIGHSKKISWFEKKLINKSSISIKDVFYFLDIHKVNEFFNSGYMQERMNARIDMIGKGSDCKIRELIFNREILDSPKLVLFHDYLNGSESDEFLNRFILDEKGIKNRNFWGTRYLGKMIAVSSKMETVELIPSPPLLDEREDWSEEIKKIREEIPKDTLGDVLGPLIDQYKN